MTATPTTSFDPQTVRRATEERDAEALLALYADDAQIEVVDSEHQPSSPQIARGKAEIGELLRDVAGRDMTHRVEGLALDGDKLAFTVRCAYPDGTLVLCMASAQIEDGKIVRQTNLQVWDA
ncbi:MAG TPA: nuclear transport factor 2 family protein [Thermoleophilaceae bacterium]|jgi:hypothetical protein